MIENIFWDIDETLIHTMLRVPEQKHVKLEIEDGGNYYTIIRPCSKALIEFSRELVGYEKVFILTSATIDYAREVNRLADWGFRNDMIIAREDIAAYSFNLAYGGTGVLAHKLANLNNVLIDNLPPRYNEKKIDLIGITTNRYFQIRDYYGVDFPEDPFEDQVKAFLMKVYENDSIDANDDNSD